MDGLFAEIYNSECSENPDCGSCERSKDEYTENETANRRENRDDNYFETGDAICHQQMHDKCSESTEAKCSEDENEIKCTFFPEDVDFTPSSDNNLQVDGKEEEKQLIERSENVETCCHVNLEDCQTESDVDSFISNNCNSKQSTCSAKETTELQLQSNGSTQNHFQCLSLTTNKENHMDENEKPEQKSAEGIELIELEWSDITDVSPRTSEYFDVEDQCELQLLEHIEMVTAEDKNTSLITDLAILSDNKLAVVDIRNKSIKIVDVHEAKVVDRREFSDRPDSLTTVTKDTFAVLFPDSYKIRIMNSNKGLPISTHIRVAGKCKRIVSKCNNLWLLFINPAKIQELDITGEILRTIKLDADVLSYYSSPCFFAISDDMQSFYISDKDSKSVIHVSIDGELINVFNDALEDPFGLSLLPDKSVYVADPVLGVISLLSPDFKKSKIVCIASDGISKPGVLCFLENEKKLFVGNSGTLSVVKVATSL